MSEIVNASISGDSKTRFRFTTAPGTRNYDCPLLLDHQPSLKAHLPFIVSFLNWPSVMPLASVLKIFPPWSVGVTFRWSTPPTPYHQIPYDQSTAPPYHQIPSSLIYLSQKEGYWHGTRQEYQIQTTPVIKTVPIWNISDKKIFFCQTQSVTFPMGSCYFPLNSQEFFGITLAES